VFKKTSERQADLKQGFGSLFSLLKLKFEREGVTTVSNHRSFLIWIVLVQ
jgi:hypothetical protein